MLGVSLSSFYVLFPLAQAFLLTSSLGRPKKRDCGRVGFSRNFSTSEIPVLCGRGNVAVRTDPWPWSVSMNPLANTLSVLARHIAYKDQKCWVRVRLDALGRDLEPTELVDVVRSLRHFDLQVLSSSPTGNNEEDGFLYFNFFPNVDLIKKSDQLDGSWQSNTTCHFESVDEDRSHSAINLCDADQVSGLLRHSGHTFFIGADRNGFFLEPQTLNHCDFFTKRQKRAVRPNTPHYYADYLDGIRRYVELVFIADHSVYEKYDKDEKKIHDRMHSIANVVNSLYAPINIRVYLVYADIWKDVDPFPITENSDAALNHFLTYRKGFLFEHPHDNAHLLTEMRFANNVIGKAYRGTMCSYDFSGGVIYNDERIAFVGSTVAHEMGHNFGMEHDAGYTTPCKCAMDLCIMSPSSGSSSAATFWSDCSLENLQSALKRGVDYCLQNVPKQAFGGAKCGNGIVEEGEDCDCGSIVQCPNKCCVASTCKLAAEAECADGDCCNFDTCKPKPLATVCRKADQSCDLPEYCDGENPQCPPDFFVQNGLTCPDAPNDFCYEGQCGSRDQQCAYIWGETGKDSDKDCYQLNKYGNANGNCGYDPVTERYAQCARGDETCGRLQCTQLSERPVFGDPSTVYVGYTAVRKGNGQDVACRTVRTTYSGGKRQGDPGMVPDGASCGKDKMCVKSKCTNRTQITEMVSKCDPTNCHGKGICNNVGNCHCLPGYGGTACDIPGYGGSVNSGPSSDKVFSPGTLMLYFFIVAIIAFIAGTVYCKRKRDFWLHKRVWKFIKKALGIEAVRVPIRKAPPPPGGQRRSLSPWEQVNAMWNRLSTPQAPRPQTHLSPPTVQHHQPREVLTVGAAMPVLPNSFMPPSHVEQQASVQPARSASHTQATPHVFYNTNTDAAAIKPYSYELPPTAVSYERPPPEEHDQHRYGDFDDDDLPQPPRHMIRTAPTAQPVPHSALRSQKVTSKLPEQRRLNGGDSSSGSSSNDETTSPPGTIKAMENPWQRGVARMESQRRPTQAPPPPPPHKPKPVTNKPMSPPTARKPKPILPSKPPVAVKSKESEEEPQISVKDLAAKLNAKLSNM